MTDPLVTTQWLADHLADADLRVFDASWFMPGTPRDAKAEFVAGHIPGAVRFDIDALSDQTSSLPHMLPDPAEFAVAMRRLGLSKESVVVVYDSEGVFSAPRAWWMLRAFGHAAVFVLDGGLPKWVAEGRAVEQGWPTPEHGDFKAYPRPDLVRDLAAMRAVVAAKSPTILDARPAARFHGQAPEPRPGLRSGHMPGAVNAPWSLLVDRGAMHGADRLAALFAGLGVDVAKPAIATCGSGVSACVIALALARVGHPDTPVYDGSWAEWGALADAPVAAEAAG